MDIEYLTVNHLSTKELTRVFSKIVTHDDLWFNGTPCWIWISNRTTDCGYGHITFHQQTIKVHRLIFAWLIHPLPKGREYGEIDHLCKITACCNPLHLEFVSARINTLRSNNPPSQNARKTHCKHGHPLEGDNLFYDQGKRQCRICKNAATARRKLRHPEAIIAAQKKYREIHKDKLMARRIAMREITNARNRERYRLKRLTTNTHSG